jgi:hypothetical protein
MKKTNKEAITEFFKSYGIQFSFISDDKASVIQGSYDEKGWMIRGYVYEDKSIFDCFFFSMYLLIKQEARQYAAMLTCGCTKTDTELSFFEKEKAVSSFFGYNGIALTIVSEDVIDILNHRITLIDEDRKYETKNIIDLIYMALLEYSSRRYKMVELRENYEDLKWN